MVVMYGKQYLVALHGQGDELVLHTLPWADEIRNPDQALPMLPSRSSGKGRAHQFVCRPWPLSSDLGRPRDGPAPAALG
ncbi:hypothetical protein [Streptomyces glomeratus]|uniref:Uncharacterized protein n=1 Tax=Streptomyces glomeratus TaxID=284452 RepID=A0ABP6M0G9_9ACTN|nr:hypothetical protein [Streptomyces glomeratus]MCF1512659.1 hypothetical protein [Streptomyces glomeratus]